MTTAISTELTLNLPAMREELELLTTAADASLADGQLAPAAQTAELRSVIVEGERFLLALRMLHGRSVAFNRGQSA